MFEVLGKHDVQFITKELIDFIVHFTKEQKHPHFHVTRTVLCLYVFNINLGDFRRIQTCELQDFI